MPLQRNEAAAMSFPPPPQQRRNNYDHPHSDLEVVPDGGGNYDKFSIPSSPYSDRDKILVPPQPYYQKELAVEQNAYGPGGTDRGYNSPGAGYGNGDDGAALPHPGRRQKILGLRRKTFFILVWIVSIALAIAIGVGAGVGASSSRSDSGSSNTDANDAAAAAAEPKTPATGVRDEITAAVGPAASTPSQRSTAAAPPTGEEEAEETPRVSVSVTTRTPAPTTVVTTAAATAQVVPPPPTTTAAAAPPPSSTAAASVVGGRCSNQWGSDCVCLDKGICRDVWRGTAYTGYEGNWPCPGAASADVMACVVKPCLGKVKGTQCMWREACREVEPGEFDVMVVVFGVMGFWLTTLCSGGWVGGDLSWGRGFCLLCA
ncbi:hypothetical protein QBC39DRAFT_112222 [Podospora conica]|nr:hypothetical protein QBC39DRAFT_112222 [Schizothecium conicum]